MKLGFSNWIKGTTFPAFAGPGKVRKKIKNKISVFNRFILLSPSFFYETFYTNILYSKRSGKTPLFGNKKVTKW
jgi:hypothetical protein